MAKERMAKGSLPKLPLKGRAHFARRKSNAPARATKSPIELAELLAEELPALTQFRGQTVVVKYGGAAMENEDLKAGVMSDIAALSSVGVSPVLVHGGGPEVSRWLERAGIEAHFVGGKRVTTDDAMEVVEMVLAGKVNKELVSLACSYGAPAVGLTGRDMRMMEARREQSGTLGRVGEITSVDAISLDDLLQSEYIPIIATIGEDENDRGALNINADDAAGEIASALGADKLVLMTDVPGIMMDKNDPTSFVQHATLAEVQRMQDDGRVQGGMIPKVECATQAVKSGASSAHIIDGRTSHSLLLATLLEQTDIGTQIVQEDDGE